MPGAALELDLNGLAAFAEKQAAELRGLSYQEPLRTTRLLLVAATREGFAQGQSPDGVTWASLKRPSARRGGASSKPLRDTGLLMGSVTAQGAGHVEQITDTTLTFGTNLSYAGYHQWGTRTIPARVFLGIGARTAEKIERVFVEFLEKQLGG